MSHQTKLQKEDAKLPTKLEFLTVKYNRGLIKTKKEQSAYRRLVAGAEGEKTVQDYLKQYGQKHWISLSNMWMNHFGPFECDLILITRHKVYIFEVKHFRGELVYRDGLTELDGKPLNIHPIHQARRNSKNIQELLCRHFPHVPVKGVLVFSGIDNAVEIQSEITDLKIVSRNELYTFVRKIAREENAAQGIKINGQRLIAHLETYEINASFGPEPLTTEEMARVKRGIFCANCTSYDVQIEKFRITCQCGHTENSEKAILRTINDYAVLNFNSVLTRRELLHFFDGQVSGNFLRKILRKYFKIIKKGGHTYYEYR